MQNNIFFYLRGVRIKLVAGTLVFGGSEAELTKTDLKGISIKPSEIGRVFDKGFVGSNGRAGNHATGIGLYLCKQMCDKLGIGIGIASEPNQYTTVTLYFPKNA